jgi:hypothetical protein
VPSFFTAMDDLGWLIGRLLGRFVGPTDEPNAVPSPGINPPTPVAVARHSNLRAAE